MRKIITVAVLAVSALGLVGQVQAAAPPMPDFRGNSVTAVFNTMDHKTKVEVKDVSGLDRHVLWPADWKVCTQSPAPGEAVSDTVSIGAVKRTEECPREQGK
jgi:opacity protein-like surface antigen